MAGRGWYARVRPLTQEYHGPKPFRRSCFRAAQCRPLPSLSARCGASERKGGASPIIDYADDWPGWKIRTDRFARDAPKSRAVLHSAQLLLSTFITHRRRLLIRYCGRLAGRQSTVFCVLAVDRASSFSSLSRNLAELITRLSIREHNCDSSIDWPSVGLDFNILLRVTFPRNVNLYPRQILW